jgi:N-acetylmuramoyl-L-alanine amidase
MKKRIRGYFLMMVAFSVLPTVLFAASPLIILDSGHDPLHPGARAVCGEFEHVYNDRIVAAFLKTTSARVLLTREPGNLPASLNLPEAANTLSGNRQTLKTSLQARTELANSNNGDLFISIHHDSVARRFIVADKKLCGGKGGHKIAPEFRKKHAIGFNVFVHQEANNPHYPDSLRFAKLVSEELLALGREASTYHYFPEDDCRSCRPVIRELGIWHQQLYVLRQAQMPAVLIEVGNIVDVEDEVRINTAPFRFQFARALDRAISRYFSGKPVH